MNNSIVFNPILTYRIYFHRFFYESVCTFYFFLSSISTKRISCTINNLQKIVSFIFVFFIICQILIKLFTNIMFFMFFFGYTIMNQIIFVIMIGMIFIVSIIVMNMAIAIFKSERISFIERLLHFSVTTSMKR